MEYIKLISKLIGIQIFFVAVAIILSIFMYENKDKD
jgi:hypothetical protein